jgi:hypothetical protein
MTTYTSISNAAVAVGAIPSSTTVTALRDNPAAIAEAAAGAPVVFAGWHPVSKVSVGDGEDGLIYNHAVDGTIAAIETPNFEDGYEYRLVADKLSHNNGTSTNIVVDFYKETVGLYESSGGTASFTAGGDCCFDMQIYRPRATLLFHFGPAIVTTNMNAPVFVAFGAYEAPAQKVLKARIRAGAGSIDDGKVWLFRRKEYSSSP